jgi:hypothetical protein
MKKTEQNANWDTDYEESIGLQGSWGWTPTDPFLDQQAKNKTTTQPSLYRMVETAFQDSLFSGDQE